MTGLTFMNRDTSDARVKESAMKVVVTMSCIPRTALAYAEAVCPHGSARSFMQIFASLPFTLKRDPWGT